MRVLLPLWIAAVAYAWSGLDTGWIPHDEGTLAQAAERVMMGELPHRDFDEVYTGGLDWVNAAAFRLFGTSLRSMRIPVFALFVLWVPAVYWIAARFASPAVAALCTALAVAWSLPTYPAPMPSWYGLFFATFGALALLKHAESGRRRWLAAAGLCAGLSVLAKITGLHFVAAGLFWCAWKEPAVSSPGAQAGDGRRGFLYPAALTAALAGLVLVLVKQIWPLGARLGFCGEIEHFVLPQACLAAAVAHRAWRGSSARDVVRARAFLSLALPFLGGVLAPVLLFVLPFAAGGGLAALYEGVLVLPARRTTITTTSGTPPEVWTLAYAAPFVALALLRRPRERLRAQAGLAVLVPTRFSEWFSAAHVGTRHLLPLAAIAAAWRLARARAASIESDRLAILLSVSAFVSLVQFPFSVPIYFFYCAPLLPLLVLATLAQKGVAIADRPGILVLAFLLLSFMVAIPMRTGAPWQLRETARLATPRGGLEMHPGDVGEYDRLVLVLREHAKGGFTWAGPDAPEVPFLCALRNPTRTIFDCFDRDFDDPAKRAARILRAIDGHGVTAVAILHSPSFSGALPADLEKGLRARFPESVRTGRYEVAWRE